MFIIKKRNLLIIIILLIVAISLSLITYFITSAKKKTSTSSEINKTFALYNLTSGDITVNISDKSSKPASNVTFNLIQNDKVMLQEISDKNGNVTFSSIPFGNYTIKEVDGPYKGMEESASLNNNSLNTTLYFPSN